MSTKRLAMGLSAALLTAAFALPATARTFCCTDKSGRKICGDTLPEQCEDRAYKEFGDKGKIRNVEAPLTPEQKAQREAEEARKKEAERAAAEARRKDQALLNTYASEKEIDLARDRAIADHETIAKQAREKLERATKRRQQFDKELEFYTKKPVPPELKAQIKEADTEIQAQQKILDDKKRDVEETRNKFEEDKKRYRELIAKPAGR